METHTIRPRRRGRPWTAAFLCLLALLALIGVRFAGVQPFRMPSGSMQPTLQVGDCFLANKWSYGYSRYSFAPFQNMLPRGRVLPQLPQRGDVVVFRPGPEQDRDFVKRLVGLPGDRIQMIGGQLYINDQAVRRESLGVVAFVNEDGQTEQLQEYRETLPSGVSYITIDRREGGELDNTRVYVVPAGNYFMLGDDRDNSANSRVPSVVGYVPLDNLVGKVGMIFPGAQSQANAGHD